MDKFDLLKSHIEAFTRKDGTVVQAHDDKRVAAKHSSATLNVLAGQHEAESSMHDKLATKKGVDHPDYDRHTMLSSLHAKMQYHAEQARDAKDGSEERSSHMSEHARLKGKLETLQSKTVSAA